MGYQVTEPQLVTEALEVRLELLELLLLVTKEA